MRLGGHTRVISQKAKSRIHSTQMRGFSSMDVGGDRVTTKGEDPAMFVDDLSNERMMGLVRKDHLPDRTGYNSVGSSTRRGRHLRRAFLSVQAFKGLNWIDVDR